jgi:8-oxo-dGTP diphosphatase
MINVSCGIIIRDGKIFAVQKAESSSHPLKWEFPGGKIANGETEMQCIVRELKEELLIDVEVLENLAPVEYAYNSKSIKLIPFVCRILSGFPVLTEHISSCWFAFSDWPLFDWAEADLKMIQVNRDRIQRACLSNQLRENHGECNENGGPA